MESLDVIFRSAQQLLRAGRLLEAKAVYERMLVIEPDNPAILWFLTEVYVELGNTNRAKELSIKALAYEGNYVDLYPRLHSNYLYCLQYCADQDESNLFEAHKLYNVRFNHYQPKPIKNRCKKRLKIGYVSADFARHPVGFFLSPVLINHDYDRFEIYCYSQKSTSDEDELTSKLKAAFNVWRETTGLDDDFLFEMILHDEIDILVDLSGHTAYNRLPVFARRVAPIQITWAGYVGTTGLSAMDYIISDKRQTPLGTEHLYTEKVLRMPDAYICYDPPEYAPPVNILPAERNGYITFGCFNNLRKINAEVMKLWAKILREIPDSKLILATNGDNVRKEHCKEITINEGIEDRITYIDRLPHKELLAEYGKVDIALDPFPYSGGLTTLEALLMGVPVVTIGGNRFASRHSISYLQNVSLHELIAQGQDEYISIVSRLSNNIPRLKLLRQNLRPMLLNSPLCDGLRFTRNLEALFARIS